MEERLARLLPNVAARMTVTPFHGLGLQILRTHGARLGLPDGFGIAGEDERSDLLASALSISPRLAARRLAALSRCKRTGDTPPPESDLASALVAYRRAMGERGRRSL